MVFIRFVILGITFLEILQMISRLGQPELCVTMEAGDQDDLDHRLLHFSIIDYFTFLG